VNNIVEPESGVKILFNIVDNCEQCGPHNIVQSCFHQYCNNLIVFSCVALQLSLNFLVNEKFKAVMSKSCLHIIKSILIAVRIIIKLYMEYVWTLLIGPVLGSSQLIDHVSDRSHISLNDRLT
jgi:hypothetical protein